MARRRQFRFGLPIVLAGRPSVGGVGLGCQPIRYAAAARFGAFGSVLPDSVLSDSKSPRRIFRRGLTGDLLDMSNYLTPRLQGAGSG
jgi:hypothetical protein